jgi:hypothetical protein
MESVFRLQLRQVAELQVQYNDLMKTARENQSQFIQDREMLQGGPGDYWKLSPEGILNGADHPSKRQS